VRETVVVLGGWGWSQCHREKEEEGRKKKRELYQEREKRKNARKKMVGGDKVEKEKKIRIGTTHLWREKTGI